MLGDESWFDAQRTAPGWKAAFFINECPPLSALVVDRGVYDGHVALQPALAAAGRFRQLLRKHGITAGRGRRSAARPTTRTALAQVESEPLPDVLEEMDRESDNFTRGAAPEGARRGGGRRRARPRRERRSCCATSPTAGVPLAGVRIFDGSGLSLDDRLTARALAALLVAAWNDPDLREPFWAALPVAGVSGTLEDRMRARARARRGAGEDGHDRTARRRSRATCATATSFAVLQNGCPVATWSARKAQDRFATALASAL